MFVTFLSVAPPERPTAPKPGQQAQLPAAAFSIPHDAVPGMPASLAMGMPQLPSAEAPKLKDFLPFMKPGSFGQKAGVGSHVPTVSSDYAPGSAGSLPASVAASPVHLPQASVSFPPSPQRQPPVSVGTTSNGPGSAGTGFVHADAGYPAAETLLSPTAPPGAPRSASPAHQLPPTVAHPGGPAESYQQLARSMDMAYNIPPNNSRTSVDQRSMSLGSPTVPPNMGSYAGGTSASYAGQNGLSSASHSYMQQVVDQPSALNMPAYSGPNFSQPGMVGSGGHTQRAMPSSTSLFPNQLPSMMSNTAPTAVHMLPSTTNTYPQHSGMPYSSVSNMGTSVASSYLNHSYPAGNVATSNIQQPNAAIPGVPVQQVNNSNNTQFPPAAIGSSIEVLRPHYYQTPAVVPPACTSTQPSCQSNTSAAVPPVSSAGQPLYQSAHVRPPSYQAVTQQYLPPQLPQLVNPAGCPSNQPGFIGGPPTSSYIQLGLSNAPVQPSYHAVRPDVSYGGVHLPGGSQQPIVTTVHPQHDVSAHSQQLPSTHLAMPAASQRPPLATPQRPVIPPASSENQSRYGLPGQTVPGVPMLSQQHPVGVGHAPLSQTPSQTQFPANVHMPATQPQPGYPSVPNTSQTPYPGAVQQFQPAYHSTGQQPVASQMPVQPAVTSQQQQQHYPVRLEVAHVPGYPPGNPSHPSYAGVSQAYQASTQSIQPPPSQQVHYQSFTPQQQTLNHPGSSQPAIINQSPAVSSSNFATAQTPYSHQQQSNASASYSSHVVENATGQIQALADIPVCLPSPLQPSRVTSAEVSKNIDSLSDLDLSGKTASSTAQKDSSGRMENGEGTEGKDMALDSSGSREDQREKSEEETRRSLRQSRSSRDVYADPDTLTRFVAEVEKFQKHVDSLVKPTLGGYFPLDKEWKVRFLFSMWYFLLFVRYAIG